MDTENRDMFSGGKDERNHAALLSNFMTGMKMKKFSSQIGQFREAGTRRTTPTRVRSKQGAFSFWVHMRRSMELAYG
jgi:hypothetical protein